VQVLTHIMANMDKTQEIHEEHVLSALETPEPGKPEVDTVHNDEAMKVIVAYSGPPTWDAVEEKKLRRKLDMRLLPILTITYALQYYDKGANDICSS
jgi:hypothetical protein